MLHRLRNRLERVLAILDEDRRSLLKAGGGWSLVAALAAAGLLPSKAALADGNVGWNKAAFDGKNVAETLKALDIEPATASASLVLTVPDIADNGAVVPVQILSRLAGTTRLALMVEKNPSTLAAVFEILPDAIADVATRIKMAQTSNVVAIAVADGKVYSATKEVKVTLGGCGT
jgi:sulfur-oxidizing protein SoxY